MDAKKHSRLQTLEIATDGIAGTYKDVVSTRDATMTTTVAGSRNNLDRYSASFIVS